MPSTESPIRDLPTVLTECIETRAALKGVDRQVLLEAVKATIDALDYAVGSGTTVDELAGGGECVGCGIWFADQHLHQLDDGAPLCEDCNG